MVSGYEVGDAKLINKKDLYNVDPNLCDRIDSNVGRDDRVVVTLFSEKLRKPVAVIAATLLENGYLEWWGLIGKEVVDEPLSFVRTVKKFSDEVTDKVKPNGHYLLVYEGDVDSQKWAEFWKFKKRGFIKELKSTGLNYFLYERPQ